MSPGVFVVYAFKENDSQLAKKESFEPRVKGKSLKRNL